MPLTRKILADLGVPKEHIDAIMGSRDEILEGYSTQKETEKAVADAVAKAVADEQAKQPDITKHPDYVKLQGDLTAKDETHKKELSEVRLSNAVQIALAGAKVKNTKAATALLDMSKLEMQEDGTVKGLKEAVEGLQKSDAYLFDTGTPQQQSSYMPSGFNPPAGGGGGDQPKSLADAIASHYNTTNK